MLLRPSPASHCFWGCSVVGIRSGYEQPPYTVLERIGESVEVPHYGTRLAAEAKVEAADAEAGRNEAFKIHFDYISGTNQGQSKVVMTAPVEVGTAAEEIAISVPIETAASDNKRYTIRFFLPGSYVKATAPEPTDAKAQIVEVPPASVAVLRFSGSREDERIDKRKAELMEALDDPDWKVTGTPTALFYDPPWTITFLRRNEAVVAVAPSQRQD